MVASQQFSITLPLDIAEVVEAKIKSGAYNSASDVIQDGIRSLLERDRAVERWLFEDVTRGHQDYLADPSNVVPAELILTRIKGRLATGKLNRTP